MAKPDFAAVIADESVQPILAEHYPRLVRAPDASRNRAQNAFAIASAAAGSVTAALLVTQSQRLDPIGVRVVSGALAAWLLASAIYITAVAIPLRHPPKVERDPRMLASRVIKQAWDDRVWVDRLTITANVAAMVALFATAFGFLTIVPELHKPDSVSGKVLLSRPLSDDLAALCQGVAPTTLSGRIERRSLEANWLIVHTDASSCPQNSVLRLPQSQVQGVEADLP